MDNGALDIGQIGYLPRRSASLRYYRALTVVVTEFLTNLVRYLRIHLYAPVTRQSSQQRRPTTHRFRWQRSPCLSFSLLLVVDCVLQPRKIHRVGSSLAPRPCAAGEGSLIDGIIAFDGASNVGVAEFQMVLVPQLAHSHLLLHPHAVTSAESAQPEQPLLGEIDRRRSRSRH